LLVLLPGLAQVHVDVDEPGADDLAGGVDALRPLGRRQLGSDPLDGPAVDQHVLHAVDAVDRIDDGPVLDQHRRAGPAGAHSASPVLGPARSSRTPMRTATPLATWSRITE